MSESMRLFPVGVKGGKRSFFFIITPCEGLFLLRAFPVHRTGNLTPTAAGPGTKFRGYYMPFLPSVNLFVKERFTQKQVGFWVLSGLFLGNGLGALPKIEPVGLR